MHNPHFTIMGRRGYTTHKRWDEKSVSVWNEVKGRHLQRRGLDFLGIKKKKELKKPAGRSLQPTYALR